MKKIIYSMCLLFILMGCSSMGILNYETPKEERCVLKAVYWDYEYLKIDNKKMDSHGVFFNFIIPSGKHLITIGEVSDKIIKRTRHETYEEIIYIPNGDTWSRSVLFDFEPGKIYVIKTSGEDMIVEQGSGIAGGFIGYYGNPHIKVGYDYGPCVKLEIGPTIGMDIFFGNFHTIIGAEGGGEFGLSYTDDIGTQVGFFYGATANFFIKKYGIGLGYGMAGGRIDSIGEYVDNTYYFPYVEVKLARKDMRGGSSYNDGIYFRYNFNNADKLYNKFAVGLKFNM